MYYLNPQLLHLIPVFGLCAFVLVLLNYWRKVTLHRQFGDLSLLAETSKPLTKARYVARALFAGLTAAALVLALARPVIPNGSKMIAQGSLDVVTMVDVSRSMAAMDYEGLVPLSAVAKPLVEQDSMRQRIGESPQQSLGGDEPGTRLEIGPARYSRLHARRSKRQSARRGELCRCSFPPGLFDQGYERSALDYRQGADH